MFFILLYFLFAQADKKSGEGDDIVDNILASRLEGVINIRRDSNDLILDVSDVDSE
jgi:hypothetical protein